MKTNLDRTITTLEEAKSFLRELVTNKEEYHPEDDAHDIIWGLYVSEPPTPEECDKLNTLMEQVYNVEFDNQREAFDPCGFILDLQNDDNET